MKNETGEKCKIELTDIEVWQVMVLIIDKIERGFATVEEMRSYLKIHDKLNDEMVKINERELYK